MLFLTLGTDVSIGANPRDSIYVWAHTLIFVSKPLAARGTTPVITIMGEFRPAHVIHVPKVLIELVTASCYRHSVTRSR